MRILIVEDDKATAEMVKRGLTGESYAVDIALNAAEAETMMSGYLYDLIILDLMLPDRDGFELCLEMREKRNDTRILMLTGKANVRDRIRGLNAGADDYLVKPFDFGELAARVRALIRRDAIQKSPEIHVGDLTLNSATMEVRRGEELLILARKEYAMLAYFMSHPDMVITRRMLEEHVWNMSLNSESNLIDVYINRLRRKIDGGSPASMLETIRGVGYRLRSSP